MSSQWHQGQNDVIPQVSLLNYRIVGNFSQFKGKSVWNNFSDFKWTDLWISVVWINFFYFIFATPYTVHENKNPAKIFRYTVCIPSCGICHTCNLHYLNAFQYGLVHWGAGWVACAPWDVRVGQEDGRGCPGVRWHGRGREPRWGPGGDSGESRAAEGPRSRRLRRGVRETGTVLYSW